MRLAHIIGRAIIPAVALAMIGYGIESHLWGVATVGGLLWLDLSLTNNERTG